MHYDSCGGECLNRDSSECAPTPTLPRKPGREQTEFAASAVFSAARHATAARSGVATAGTERRSSRSVRQKAEPPLRRNEGSGVVTTR